MSATAGSAVRPIGRFPNPNKPMTPISADEAWKLKTNAAVKRAVGKAMIEEDGDVTGGRFELAEARDMEAAAGAFLDPGKHVTGPHEVGNGGELVLRTAEAMGSVPGIVDTLRESPDVLNTTASRDRLELAGDVGVLSMSVDASESIKARNSLEKMFAHEMAAAHSLAMRFAARSSDLLRRQEMAPANQTLSVEACRLANTAARLMGVYQDGLVALERFRRGGRQTVEVVHQTVAVAAGGQAVVAGSVKARGRKRVEGRK
jgi:hypothetical protein